MKKKITDFSISLIIVIILGSVFTLLFSLLFFFKIIDEKSNAISLKIISYSLFFIFGFTFGYKEKEKGLVNGLLLIVIYLLVSFTISTLASIELIDSKQFIYNSFVLLLGSLIGSFLEKRINPS